MPVSTARRGVLALLLAALILFVLGSIEMARGATHGVTISDFTFGPAELTITAGDTVTWTNEDAVIHTATSATGAFDSGDLPEGASFSFTFETPGTYDYLCTPHPSMTGRIVVLAAAPAPASPAGGGTIPDVAMPSTPDPEGTPALVLGTLALAAGLVVTWRRRRA